MNKSSERLYNLLPAIYRIRDVDKGEPLRALLSVIENELQDIEKDIDDLYRNWFIETCDEWVVAYIGDLLGVRNLHPISTGNFSLRPYVANTLAYRRRKGTATVLEQLARDVTGWPARAVEFFHLLSVTSHFNHVTLARGQTLNLRDSKNLELLNSPFECAAYTGEVRHINSNRGKYNISNIGIFLWRLQSYTVTRGSAHAVSEPPDGRYTFNPLGLDAPLFNQPHTETEITHLAEEINVPGVLRRRLLYDELEARRQALVDNQTRRSLYFDEQPVLEIFINGQSDPIPSEQILICDLSDLPPSGPGWPHPHPTKKYIHINTDGTRDEHLLQIKVAVDPKLGRLAFPMGDIPSQVEVSYAYGFSGDIGSGPYNRSESISQALTRPVTWEVGVSSELAPLPGVIFATLAEAVDAWNAQDPGKTGVIAILDSHTYVEELTGDNRSIKIPKDSQLIIVAASWPEVDDPDLPGLKKHIIGQWVPEGLRPHLLGNLSVEGTAIDESFTPGEFVLDGLLVEGKLTILPGNLGKLRVAHCTLAPDYGSLVVDEVLGTQDQHKQNSQLSICIDRCICGPITLTSTVPKLHIVNSIVDKIDSAAITAPGANTDIQMSTIFGSSRMRSLEASNSIFTGVVKVERRQLGCMRFSYVPDNSQTPHRYYCQPDLALKGVITPTEQDNIRARLTPSFTSMRYGDPAYAQLSLACALEIRTGAEDGSEMGAFNDLKQSQREANLLASLDEYMRFELEAGIFYVT